MKKLLIFSLIILLTNGCDDLNEVEEKNGLFFISNLEPEMSEPRIIDWKIGRKREKIVSKGLRISSTIPRLSDKAKRILQQKGSIDSWIIRITKETRGASQNIGYFYMKLHNITRSTKQFTISLYYHAASVSKRFRLFHCPAFNHRLEVTNFDIRDRSFIEKENLYIRPLDSFPGQVSQLRFAPTVVSGGQSLIGVYHIDMALYSAKTKIIHSKWLPVKGALHITQETPVSVPSCLGIKEENTPLPESNMPSLRDLEIK